MASWDFVPRKKMIVFFCPEKEIIGAKKVESESALPFCPMIVVVDVVVVVMAKKLKLIQFFIVLSVSKIPTRATTDYLVKTA